MRKTLWVCLVLGFSLLLSTLFARPLLAGPGVSPSSVSFGSVTVGATSSRATVVVSNNGQSLSILKVSTSLSEFIVSGPALPLNLGPHGSATFQVVFAPDSAANFNGIVSFATNFHGGSNVLNVSVSGTGVAGLAAASPTYFLSPGTTSLSFGNTLVGTSGSQTLSLTNTGTGSVSISQVSVAGTGFSVSGFFGTVTLAAGQSLSLSVNFAPPSVGTGSGSISVVSTATSSPTVSLSGTGVQPAISVVPPSFSFTNVTVGTTNTQTVTITNPGTANLTVSQASLVGTNFSFSGLTLPLTVAPGGSSPFTVSFAPSSATTYSASLTLANNSPTPSAIVPMSGSAVSPILTLSASPTSFSFPSTTTGTSSASQSVTLTNSGNSVVSISQVTASTNFSVSGLTLPVSLSAGQSTTFSVIFAPTTTGSLSGTVTVTSNASNSPTTITLSGSGASSTSPSVGLTWSPSSTTYSSFDIYRGTTSGGPYTKINSSLTPFFTDTSVTSGQTYYYVVTEFDSSGTQSGYSNQAAANVP